MTLDRAIVKSGASKIRRLAEGTVLAGFRNTAVVEQHENGRYRDDRGCNGKGNSVLLQRIATPIEHRTLC